MTIRQFKFTGSNNNNAVGTITINGNQVFNGPFLGTELDSQDEITATGSVDIDNSLAVENRITAPTVITVSEGEICVALTQWDYLPIANPAYSAEQFAILNTPETPRADRVAIYNAVAVPPLSVADEAMLFSTDPEDQPAQQAVLVAHNLTKYVQLSTNFGFGATAADSACNRTNVLLNGSPVAEGNTNAGILIQSGDVLTYNSIVFASNISG
jgi:hypothetical protein